MAVTTTNFIRNPSAEGSFGAWIIAASGSGETLTQDASEFLYGSKSAKIVCTGGSAFQGVQFLSDTTGVGSGALPFTGSAYVKGTGTAYLATRIWANGFANARETVSGAVVLSGSWQRIVATATGLGGDTIDRVDVYITPNWVGGMAALTAYVDGVQVEAGTEATAYFDGSLTDTATTVYDWTGTPDDSPSTRVVTNNQTLRRIRSQFELRPY